MFSRSPFYALRQFGVLPDEALAKADTSPGMTSFAYGPP